MGQDDIRTRAAHMPICQIVSLIKHDTEMVYKNNNLERQLAEARAQLDKIATHIHYPDCWDDVAYPTLADAVCEITRCDPEQCSKGGGK